MQTSRCFLSCALAVTMVLAVVATLGANRDGSAIFTGVAPPAVQVISFENTVGLLDTATGAVFRLRGNLANTSARKSWQLRVPPVASGSSGLLEIQRATFNDPGAIFLVDVVTGQTWLLQDRGNGNGSWDPVVVE